MNRYLTYTGLLLLVSLCSEAIAGVHYYSGTQNVTFQGVTQPDTWNPIQSSDTGSAAIGFTTSYASPDLFWADSSTGIYAGQFTVSGSKLNTVAYNTTLSGTSTTYTGDSKFISGSIADRAVGYTSGSDNYFGWKVQASGSDFYLGWARFKYDPDPPVNNDTDKFIIIDWAYNLVSSSSTITVGDSSTNTGGGGGQVPEPTGLAIFAFGAIGIASLRRREK